MTGDASDFVTTLELDDALIDWKTEDVRKQALVTALMATLVSSRYGIDMLVLKWIGVVGPVASANP